jgi:uncharacterized protein YciI
MDEQTEKLRDLVRKTRKTGRLLVAGMFVPIDGTDYESGMRREIATYDELVDALQFDIETLQMANTYLRTLISPVDAEMEGWTLEGWHGFNFEDAARCSAWDRRRLIEITAGFAPNDLRGSVYLIPQNGDPTSADPHGRATFNASGDTLVFRVRTRDGFEQIYDCKVRRIFHPRREGCGPDK